MEQEAQVSEIDEGVVDIPDPERDLPAAPPDESAYDPGGDIPPPPRQPELGEDPAYDPGGLGGVPETDEDDYR